MKYSTYIGLNHPSVGNGAVAAAFRGFTLTELMVTLVVVGVLGALAAPSLGAAIKNHRISGQSNDLLADLTFARTEAVKRAATVSMCKQDAASSTPSCDTTAATAWTAGWAIFIDTDGNGQINGADTVLRVHQAIVGGNTLTSARTGGENAANIIRFRNNGTTTINASEIARLRFCDSRGNPNALTVELAATGRSRVNSTPPALPAPCPSASDWT